MPITVEDVKILNQNAAWSTERTLQKILAAMPGDGENATEKAARAALEDNTKAVAASRSSLSKAFDGLGYTFNSAIKGGFGGPADGLKTLGGSLNTVSRNIMTDFPKISVAASIAGFALTEMAHAVGQVIEVNKTFLSVYASGVRLEGGLQGIMVAAQGAGMTVQEFGSLLEKHSSTVAVLGSTRTPALIKQFQELTNRGGDLMMTQGEANEALLQSAEIFQQAGLRGGMSIDAIGKSSKDLIVQTTKLSEETGQSRKSIMDFVSSITKGGNNFLFMSTLGEQAKKGFLSATVEAQRFGPIAGKMLMENVQKMITGKGSLGLLDDNFRNMANLVPGGMDALKNLQDVANAGGDTKSAMEVFGKAMAGAPKSLIETLRISMPEVAAALGEFVQAEKTLQEKRQRDFDADTEAGKKRENGIAIGYQEAKRRREQREKEEKKSNEALTAGLNEMDAATKNLNTEFSRMYVAVGQTILPALTGLAKGINAVINRFHDFGAWIGKNVLGQSKEGAEATGGNTAAIMTMLSAGGLLYGGIKGYKGIKSYMGGTPAVAPTAIPEPPAPGAPGAGAPPSGGRMSRLGGMMGRGVGIAGVAGLAGGLAGTAVGGTAGSMITGAATMGATGAMLGSMFGPIGTVVGGLAGLGLGAYQAYKANKEDQAGGGGGSDMQPGSNPIAALDALLQSREGMNLRYTESGKALSAFSNGYRDAVNALNLNINPASLQSLGSLQDILMGRSSGLTAGQFAGFNFAETTAQYYASSQSYYNTTTNLFSEIRDFSRQMKDDMASIKSMADTYLRNQNNRPQGTPQPRN